MILAPGQTATLSVDLCPRQHGKRYGDRDGHQQCVQFPNNNCPVRHRHNVGFALRILILDRQHVFRDWLQHLPRGTTSGGPYTRLTANPVANMNYMDSSVQAGQTYYYVVTSVTSSNAESARTQARWLQMFLNRDNTHHS